MDTLTYEGTAYVKASVLAKRFRYTTDYIGQLCRAGKVDARLVGRSWYVNEAALIAHKEARYQPTRVDEKTIENKSVLSDESHHVAIAVHPRLTRTTGRQLASYADSVQKKKNFADRLEYIPATYISDEAELLPQPIVTPDSKAEETVEESKPTILPVELAEEQKVKIRTIDEPKSHLEFTDLPEIPLQGSIEVIEINPEVDIPETQYVTAKEVVRAPKAHSREAELGSLVRPAQIKKVPSFAPASVHIQAAPTERSFAVISLTVVSLAVALFLVLTFTSNVLVVEGGELRSSVDFNAASAALVWQLF